MQQTEPSHLSMENGKKSSTEKYDERKFLICKLTFPVMMDACAIDYSLRIVTTSGAFSCASLNLSGKYTYYERHVAKIRCYRTWSKNLWLLSIRATWQHTHAHRAHARSDHVRTLNKVDKECWKICTWSAWKTLRKLVNPDNHHYSSTWL